MPPCASGQAEKKAQSLSPVNSGRPSNIHSLVTVRLSENTREFTLVDIGTIFGLAHLIPEGDQCWLVNSHIVLRTFNEIYKLYKQVYDEYVRRRVLGAMPSCIYIVCTSMKKIYN